MTASMAITLILTITAINTSIAIAVIKTISLEEVWKKF